MHMYTHIHVYTQSAEMEALHEELTLVPNTHTHMHTNVHTFMHKHAHTHIRTHLHTNRLRRKRIW